MRCFNHFTLHSEKSVSRFDPLIIYLIVITALNHFVPTVPARWEVGRSLIRKLSMAEPEAVALNHPFLTYNMDKRKSTVREKCFYGEGHRGQGWR